LSKLGVCSRTQAQALIGAGRVRVDGRIVRDRAPTDARHARITVDAAAIGAAEKVYLMLNKPRGHVTTASDEHGRDTVYALLRDAKLPWLAPVGRLDKASEGLLLFTNDSAWAARLTDPASHIDKTYHVQIDALPDTALLQRLQAGIDDGGERLSANSVRELRRGERNAWLEIVLDEGAQPADSALACRVPYRGTASGSSRDRAAASGRPGEGQMANVERRRGCHPRASFRRTAESGLIGFGPGHDEKITFKPRTCAAPAAWRSMRRSA
jgi:23S rRNA pseudouridine2605 synthase